ncbi:MAG: antibiotic biosynthesis monooxygenase [Pseudomonadota bacterium]
MTDADADAPRVAHAVDAYHRDMGLGPVSAEAHATLDDLCGALDVAAFADRRLNAKKTKGGNMANETIHIHLDAKVPEANRAGFQDRTSELVERTAKESGTLVYEWCEVGDTGVWHILERYADAENGDLHVTDLAENHAGSFFELVESRTGIVLENATPYIKRALEGISPLYIGQKGGYNRF